MSGSADLSPSTKTDIKGVDFFSPENRAGRNIHFGIREHAMAAISKLFVNVGADDQLEEGLNKQIYLEFAEPTKEKLLGIELNFFLLKGLFNAKIDQIKEEINGKKVSLVPFDEKQIYITKLAFISEEDVIKYQSVDKNTYIPHFEKAKTLMEIIADEENDR